VRRDADEGRAVGSGAARCACPVGESPIPVGVGAPGSRVAVRSGEIPAAGADRQEPLRGEQPYPAVSRAHRFLCDVGPQQQVKPAASSEEQSGSRAAHVTAKATSGALVPKRTPGPSGVGGAALSEGEVRNTRGPSSEPWSRQADSYKPRAKSSGAERESEGIVVVEIRAQQNARGAKGPCFGRVG
jgi:hypothetical protein